MPSAQFVADVIQTAAESAAQTQSEVSQTLSGLGQQAARIGDAHEHLNTKPLQSYLKNLQKTWDASASRAVAQLLKGAKASRGKQALLEKMPGYVLVKWVYRLLRGPVNREAYKALLEMESGVKSLRGVVRGLGKIASTAENQLAGTEWDQSVGKGHPLYAALDGLTSLGGASHRSLDSILKEIDNLQKVAGLYKPPLLSLERFKSLITNS